MKQKQDINKILIKTFISLNNILKRSVVITEPKINQIQSKYFDQNVVLYSSISAYIELSEQRALITGLVLR